MMEQLNNESRIFAFNLEQFFLLSLHVASSSVRSTSIYSSSQRNGYAASQKYFVPTLLHCSPPVEFESVRILPAMLERSGINESLLPSGIL